MKTIIPLALLCCLGTLVQAAPPAQSAAPVVENAITVMLEGPADVVDATSFAFGAVNITSTGSGGPGAGRVEYKQLSLVREVDASTPKLLEAVVTGKHHPRVELRQGALRIRFEDVVIVDYNLFGKAGKDGGQTETLILEFTKVDVRVDP